MRFRRTLDDDLDGLTGEDIERVRAAAAAAVTPGLEGLAPKMRTAAKRQPIRSTDVLPGKKRGRR